MSLVGGLVRRKQQEKEAVEESEGESDSSSGAVKRPEPAVKAGGRRRAVRRR